MLVILKENVENLGRTGDVVRVSDGYARNYLLPRSLVVPASEGKVKVLEHHKRVLEKKRASEKSGAEGLAKRLEEHSCTLSRKVGENDKLYGSVTSGDVADELKRAGFEIDKRQVRLAEPLKTLGVHPVTVQLLPEVKATVKVWIVKEEA